MTARRTPRMLFSLLLLMTSLSAFATVTSEPTSAAPASATSQTAKIASAATSSQVEYFALGDSIASGHGLQGVGDCKRSASAYPYEVERDLNAANIIVDFPADHSDHFFACSGASVNFIDKSGDHYLGGKVDDVLNVIKGIYLINDMPSIPRYPQIIRSLFRSALASMIISH